MDLSLYLEALYHKAIAVTKTNLGLTNTIYTAIIDHQKVAIRVPNSDIHHMLKNDERKILDLIAETGLDVEEVYYDEKTGIRITKWVDGAETFKDSHDPQKDIKAIGMIKKLHACAFETDKVFDPFLMYQSFRKEIAQERFDYDKHEYLFDQYRQLNHRKILCHNDLVSGNFLFSDDKTYLIDYEYAGMNDPYFDVMSFISENEIYDQKRRELILKTYFGHKPNAEESRGLHITELMMDLLWAAWANMLYDKRKDMVYLHIFDIKIRDLLRGKNYETHLHCQ